MSAKILVVEDEEKLARFLELELIHEGYAVDSAMDGSRPRHSTSTSTFASICFTFKR